MGWPIAAQLALEALIEGSTSRPWYRCFGRARPATPPASRRMAEEVLAKEEPEVLWFLAHASTLDRFTIELCEPPSVACTPNHHDPAAPRAVPERRSRAQGVVLDSSPSEPSRRSVGRSSTVIASGSCAPRPNGSKRHDLVHEALQASMQAGDEDAVVRLLARHGEQRFSSGQIEAALAWLPEARRDGPLVPIVGGMLAMRGDLRGSLTYLQAAANLGPLVPATAWRLVATLVTLGRPHEAASVAAASQVESDDWESLALSPRVGGARALAARQCRRLRRLRAQESGGGSVCRESRHAHRAGATRRSRSRSSTKAHGTPPVLRPIVLSRPH